MPKIDINLKPSKVFISLGFIILISCFFIVYSLPIAKMVKTVLWLLTLRYGWSVLTQHGILSDGRAIHRLSLEASTWKLYDRLGVQVAYLCGESTLTQFVCILRFSMPKTGQKRSCLVFRDSVSFSDYKQLLMLLRTVSLENAEKPI